MATEGKHLHNSGFCMSILAVSVLSVAGLGYSFTCFNPLVPVLQELYNSTHEARYGKGISQTFWIALLSLTMSMILAGGFCGSVTVSLVLRLLSRKQTMLFVSVLCITGAVIISAGAGTTGSYEAVIIGRFVMGYSLGLGMNTAPVVIAEYSVPRVQALYQSMLGLAISAGAIVGPIIAHPKVKIISVTGSKNLLLGSACLTIVAHVITTTCLATQHLSKFAGYASIAGILLLLVSYNGGPNLAIYALAGELNIEPTRQIILNYSGGILWFTAWLTGFTAAYLDESGAVLLSGVVRIYYHVFSSDLLLRAGD